VVALGPLTLHQPGVLQDPEVVGQQVRIRPGGFAQLAGRPVGERQSVPDRQARFVAQSAVDL
jgi:hypothetical protein